MKKRLIKLATIMLLFILLLLFYSVQAKGIEGTTIVLNAGHGGRDSGCTNRKTGWQEKDITLKITKYLEQELNKYYNVKVILTHDGVNFPNNNCNDLAARAMVARNNNAELYASIHINDNSTDLTRNGSAVFITSRRELPKYNEGMTILANKIITNLGRLGIRVDEGIRTRLCSNTSYERYKYYDGSYADYYGDIRYAMRGDSLQGFGLDFRNGSGVPTVLIEHCFMNNEYDMQFLDSDEDLQNLAKADANAIADYLELKLPEELISKIVLNKDNINLLEGETEKINATIELVVPSNINITWSSNNEDVAEVSQDGTITAKAEGTTIITASLQEKNLYSTVTVNVVKIPEGEKIEFPVYTVKNSCISEIEEKTTIQDFISKIIVSNNLELVVETITQGQAHVGTGTKLIVRQKEQNTVLKEYECLIHGDTSGDGNITPADYIKIKNHIMKASKLEGTYYIAADVNQDNKISPADYIKVKNHIMNENK